MKILAVIIIGALAITALEAVLGIEYSIPDWKANIHRVLLGLYGSAIYASIKD